MEILLVIFVLILAFSGPIALVAMLALRKDVRRLERANAELHARLSDGGTLAPAPPSAATTDKGVAPFALDVADQVSSVKRPARDVESVIGGEWLTWIGIVTIFFGTAFFLAVDLGEHALAGSGQVGTGLLVSFVFILAGLRLSPTGPRAVLSQGLIGGGIALLFLTAYGSYGFHELVPAPFVYAFLVGVTAIGAILALRRNAMSIAVLTAVGALATPLVLQTGGDPAQFLFPYTVLVVAGASHVGMRRRWPILTGTVFLGTVNIVALWCARHWPSVIGGAPGSAVVYDEASRWIAIVCGALLWLLFVTTPIVSARFQRASGIARDVVVLLSGLAYAWLLYQLLDPHYQMFRGLALALFAAIHVAGSRVLGSKVGVDGRSMLFYTGIAIAVIAIPVQFDEWATTTAWVALGFVLVLSGVRRGHIVNRLLGYAVYAIVLARVTTLDSVHAIKLADHLHVVSTEPIANPSFLSGVAAVAALGLSAYMLHRNRERLRHTEQRAIPALIIAATVALWWRGTAETIFFFEAQQLTAQISGAYTERRLMLAVSWVWAIYAALLIAIGFIARYRPIRLLGVLFIGLLVGKVFLFDIQALERGYRIASFVGVGVLLLIISAAYQRDRKST